MIDNEVEKAFADRLKALQAQARAELPPAQSVRICQKCGGCQKPKQ